MKQTILFYSGIFTLMGALFSCEESIEWELKPGANGLLVVDAVLTNELKHQEISLTLSYDQLNEAIPAVRDAIVSVTANRTVYPFLENPNQPGHYLSIRPFAVLRNLEYQLNVEWQGQPYSAITNLSSVFPIPDFTFKLDASQNLMTFDSVPPVYNPNQQAMYEVIIDPSAVHPNFPEKAKTLFYTFNTLDVSALVRPQRDTLFFPIGSQVAVKKFGLNDDFAAYLKALAIETDWKGGFLYGSSESLPTNISNGGLGFFSACSVLVDSFVVR